MPRARLQVGVAGLGRMGHRHALNFYQSVPRADLVAVSSPDAKERKWAEENLNGVSVYETYDEMIGHQDLQAVIIASVTSVHAEQSIKALEKGLHVLCEKPLSLSAEVSQQVVDVYHATLKQFPHQKFICGFSRRFDESYQDAYRKVSSGQLGDPAIFYSQTCDLYDPSGFFVAFAQHGGGIFVDCGIHDVDLALWFLGEDSKVKSVNAEGITKIHPELRQYGDRDNAVGTIQFYNEKVATIYCCRMMAAGHEDRTEVICVNGSVSINQHPRKNHVEIHDEHGVRREISQDYWQRFQGAFANEAKEFTACCLDNTEPPIKVEGAVRAVKICAALQESMVSGEKIYFDEQGNRISK